MDEVDKALEALKFHIKKEIVDNYFGDRVYLEEDLTLLQEEKEAYARDADLLSNRFFAFYQALGSEQAIHVVLQVLGLKERPYYQQFQELDPGVRRNLLQAHRQRGFTAARRYRFLVLDVYDALQQEAQKLREQFDNINTHLRLLNEDIDKFNLSYDFGLIAAQMEAMDGHREVLNGGGLMSGEREELSTRMRFKRQKPDPNLLPPPVLPPLKQIRSRLEEVLGRVYHP